MIMEATPNAVCDMEAKPNAVSDMEAKSLRIGPADVFSTSVNAKAVRFRASGRHQFVFVSALCSPQVATTDQSSQQRERR